jgi:hypothetical protein
VRALWLAFLFVFGACATAHPLPAPAVSAPEPQRPGILGDPGETVSHLHARIIVRACSGTEIGDLADAVERIVLECVAAGTYAPECEETACRRVRSDPVACTSHFASR